MRTTGVVHTSEGVPSTYFGSELLFFGGPARKFISLVCAGLPYYTHLLGQHAVCQALDAHSSLITKSHVDSAMTKAIEDSEREMKSAYYEATHSRQPNTFFIDYFFKFATRHARKGDLNDVSSDRFMAFD